MGRATTIFEHGQTPDAAVDDRTTSLRDHEQLHEQNRLRGGLRRSSSMVKSLTLQSMIAAVVHISSMALLCFLES